MHKNRNLKDYMKWLLPLFLAIWLFLCYYSQHVVKCSDAGGFQKFSLAFDHIKGHPFDIFPINLAALATATLWFFIGCALLYVEYSRRKRLRTTGEHGSAAWNSDMKGYNKIFTAPHGKPYADRSGGSDNNWDKRNQNIILSNDVFLSTDTRKTRRTLNQLVIGGSGSGKSRFIAKPNILQANCSYVITDPKGELLESMGGFLRRRGYKIKVFNLVDMEHSNTYNPFDYIRSETGVFTMLNTLFANTNDPGATKGDPFWEKAETNLLSAICFYLYYECNKEDQNFSNVMKLLRCLEVREGQEDFESTLDIMFNNLKAKNPEHIAVRQYAVFKSAGGGRTAQSIMVTCQTRLQAFNTEAITRLTGFDNIELEKIGDEKTALFCITPVVDKTFNYLVAMLYTQLFETLYDHGGNLPGKRLPIQVRFILDEFANIGTIPDFDEKLATMRSYEISCTVIIQSISQLKTRYKENWETIIANCDSFIFLGCPEETTLKFVSERLGKETIVTQTDSRNFGGKGGGSSRSKQIVGRELMTTTELAEMDSDHCVVFLRGIKPFYGNKYDYPQHPNYKWSGDANDEYKFNVKKEIKTAAVTRIDRSAEAEKKRIRIIADKSETRNEDRINRRRTVVESKVRNVSARGVQLGKIQPPEEVCQEVAAHISLDQWNEEQVLSMDEAYFPEGFREFSEETLEEVKDFMNSGS